MTTQGLVGNLAGMAANDEKANKHFGESVRLAMRRSGVTIKDIVQELGVSRETVRLWRQGESVARDDNLKRLAKMIGVTPSDLRYEKDRAPTLPLAQGEHVTDEDELALLRAYRGLKKGWARQALRRRAVELLEEFGEPGVQSPFGKGRGNGTQ